MVSWRIINFLVRSQLCVITYISSQAIVNLILHNHLYIKKMTSFFKASFGRTVRRKKQKTRKVSIEGVWSIDMQVLEKKFKKLAQSSKLQLLCISRFEQFVERKK